MLLSADIEGEASLGLTNRQSLMPVCICTRRNTPTTN